LIHDCLHPRDQRIRIQEARNRLKGFIQNLDTTSELINEPLPIDDLQNPSKFIEVFCKKYKRFKPAIDTQRELLSEAIPEAMRKEILSYVLSDKLFPGATLQDRITVRDEILNNKAVYNMLRSFATESFPLNQVFNDLFSKLPLPEPRYSEREASRLMAHLCSLHTIPQKCEAFQTAIQSLDVGRGMDVYLHCILRSGVRHLYFERWYFSRFALAGEFHGDEPLFYQTLKFGLLLVGPYHKPTEISRLLITMNSIVQNRCVPELPVHIEPAERCSSTIRDSFSTISDSPSKLVTIIRELCESENQYLEQLRSLEEYREVIKNDQHLPQLDADQQKCLFQNVDTLFGFSQILLQGVLDRVVATTSILPPCFQILKLKPFWKCYFNNLNAFIFPLLQTLKPPLLVERSFSAPFIRLVQYQTFFQRMRDECKADPCQVLAPTTDLEDICSAFS
jgi:hypothetical protein